MLMLIGNSESIAMAVAMAINDVDLRWRFLLLDTFTPAD
jgi:hypothetical protein|uniref:Uncharacterized protein n=2 Tax=Picea TaxID=3328 RepID=A0A117NFJ9_PICGL|nr:hypothetical protein ABT39_MTgene3438 [Picea glauca]QHR92708.1 hypothetical protein Q903MT_gene6756 [Picea sitchensis]